MATAPKSIPENAATDWERFTAVMAEMEALIAAGRWTRAEYERLRAEAVVALGEVAADCIEGVDVRADPSWLRSDDE